MSSCLLEMGIARFTLFVGTRQLTPMVDVNDQTRATHLADVRAASMPGTLSRMHSFEAMDLSHIHSIPDLLSVLHHWLRTISTPLSYEQLLKNENVHMQQGLVFLNGE